MKTRIFLFILAALSLGSTQTKEKNVAKATHLGPYDVAVVCTNGSDPKVWKRGEMILISCSE